MHLPRNGETEGLLTSSSIWHSRWYSLRSRGCCLLLLAWAAAPVAAQSTLPLIGQYNRHLTNKCSQLGFARDGSGQILPNQATGTLLTTCNGSFVPTEPPLVVIHDDWRDMIQVIGPRNSERTVTQPGWRDRAIQHRLSRRDRRSGKQPTTTESDAYGYVALRPGLTIQDRDYENHSAMNIGALVGGGHWLGDSVLISGSATWIERGYAVASSLAWAPNERMFVEATVNYDDTARNQRRSVAQIPIPLSSGIIQSYAETDVFGRTRLHSLGGELYSGYDFVLGRFAIGPRVGVEYRKTRQSGYIEGTEHDYPNSLPTPNPNITPGALTFDATSQRSLTHRIGINLSPQFSNRKVLSPLLELSWVHEYEDVQRSITAHFTEDVRSDPLRFTFVNKERPRDTLHVRLGFGFKIGSRIAIFATGEAYDQGPYGRQVNSIVGVRGRW